MTPHIDRRQFDSQDALRAGAGALSKPGSDPYLERTRAARSMSIEQRLLASAELFDELCARLRDGIRSQFPEAGELNVERILLERIEIARKLEQSPMSADLLGIASGE